MNTDGMKNAVKQYVDFVKSGSKSKKLFIGTVSGFVTGGVLIRVCGSSQQIMGVLVVCAQISHDNDFYRFDLDDSFTQTIVQFIQNHFPFVSGFFGGFLIGLTK